MLHRSLLSLTICCLLCIESSCTGQVARMTPVEQTTLQPSVCSNAGYDPDSSDGIKQCVCHDGFTGDKCQVCHVCHNAAVNCSTSSEGQPVCLCRQQTTGPLCENYTGQSSSSDNIALKKTVAHCKSGARGIDMANSSIWSNDACYNLGAENVIIVDLGGIYNVTNVTIAGLRIMQQNLNVSVGLHLDDCCSVTDETHCANLVGRSNSSGKGASCDATTLTTGRYIRIQNNQNNQNEEIFCINHASGVPVHQSITQGRFSKTRYEPGPKVLPFEYFRTVSKLSCARFCLQNPICLNFQWTNGMCSLYGGSPGGQNSVNGYKYQGIV